MASLTQAVALLVTFGVCAGLLVGPVRLVNNKRYISYRLGPSPNNSLLECPYVLNLTKNEVLQKISWNFFLEKSGNEVNGSYEWTPSGGGIATGALEGVVNLNGRNGSLELTELRYDLGGYYECSATLTNGQTQKAEKWEALIIDTTSSSSSTKSEIRDGGCVTVSSVQLNTIYPEPTVHSGMYSPSLQGYYDQVTAQEWFKVVYQNKSVGYSYNNKEFKIDENTPYDAYFLLTVGVTKSDGNYISLYATEGNLLQERGCPGLKNKANQVETYRDGKKTCRNEYIKLFEDPKVVVTCQKGFHSDGDLSSLELTCDLQTFQWRSEDEGVSRDDLRCVMGDSHHSDEDDDDDGDSARVTTAAGLLVMATTVLLRLF